MNLSDNTQDVTGDRILSEALCGILSAQYQLGVLLENEKEPELASAWFKKAATRGHVEAAWRAGLLCLKSKNTQPEAAYWLHQAALRGHTQAQFHLAELYESGVGVKVDPEAALYWHRNAAGHGCALSQAKLKSVAGWWDAG